MSSFDIPQNELENCENPKLKRGCLQIFVSQNEEIAMQKIRYVCDYVSKVLMIYVQHKNTLSDSYVVLSFRDISPYLFDDHLVFILNVKTKFGETKKLNLKAYDLEEKEKWKQYFGISIATTHNLLATCISEIERRRFNLGQMKRNEKSRKTNIDLEHLISLIKGWENGTLHFDDTSIWTVNNLERVLQLLLNELHEPLIPFNCQDILRKAECTNLDFCCCNMLPSLPEHNRKSLIILLYHMEKLATHYYSTSDPGSKRIKNEFRKHIASRLAPAIFRLRPDYDPLDLFDKATQFLSTLMLNPERTTTLDPDIHRNAGDIIKSGVFSKMFKHTQSLYFDKNEVDVTETQAD